MSVDQPRNKKIPLSDNKWLQVTVAILSIATSIFLLILMVPQSVIQSGSIIYEKESRYHYIRVVDDNATRSLLFTVGPGSKIQSAIYLDSPDKHVQDYTKMVFASLAFVQQPQNILVIGLGGGIIPSTFASYFPSAQIDVVEIDGEIVKVAEDFFNFQPSDRTNIIVADGRVFIRQAKHREVRYDIIVLDAFSGSYIPSHLTTKEFLQEVFFLLKDGGCVVSNIHPRNKLYEYQLRTYSEVAMQNYVFEGTGNTIVISSQQKKSVSRQEVKNNLFQLQKQFQFSFNLGSIGKMLIEKPTWETKGDILTDDYSPVNVLKSKKL